MGSGSRSSTPEVVAALALRERAGGAGVARQRGSTAIATSTRGVVSPKRVIMTCHSPGSGVCSVSGRLIASFGDSTRWPAAQIGCWLKYSVLGAQEMRA